MEIFNLKDKVAIVTGGGSGVGKAIVNLFTSKGATVHILELNETLPPDTFSQSANHQVFVHSCDVANSRETNEVVERIIKKSQRIDILVNSAGIAHIGKLENTSESDFDRIINVNIRGVFNTMQATILQMKNQGGGVILNVSSIAASIGLKDRFAYSMSKGAVHSMTLSVAKDYIDFNVRCNSISPARVHTAFVDNFLTKNYPGQEASMFEKLSKSQPIGRMATPEEVAYLALYLCSNEASFITGNDYPIDGGFLKLNN